MPKSDEELTKHTLNLFAGDYEELRDLHPDTGAAVAIRLLIRTYLAQVRAKGGSPSVAVEIKI